LSLVKGKKDVAVCDLTLTAMANHIPYGDLMGCKAELTRWWLHPKIVYPTETVTYLRKKPAMP